MTLAAHTYQDTPTAEARLFLLETRTAQLNANIEGLALAIGLLALGILMPAILRVARQVAATEILADG